MAHAVVAVECHHRCGSQISMPGLVSVVTTASINNSNNSIGVVRNSGLMSSSSSTTMAGCGQMPLPLLMSASGSGSGSSIPSSSSGIKIVDVMSPSTIHVDQPSTIPSTMLTPNAIVTITSVPMNADTTSVPKSVSSAIKSSNTTLHSKQLVIHPNITIASISGGQTTTTSQLVTRSTIVESLPTKPIIMNVSSSTKSIVTPGVDQGSNFNSTCDSNFRLQNYSDSIVSSTMQGLIGDCNSNVDAGEHSNIIVVETNLERQLNTSEPVIGSTEFDPVKDLEWLNGVTTLPGSNLKFRYNEFGMMELITDNETNSSDTSTKTEASLADPLSSTNVKREPSRKRKRVTQTRSSNIDVQAPESEQLATTDTQVNDETESKIKTEIIDVQVNGTSSIETDIGVESSSATQSTELKPQTLPLKVEKRGRPLGSKNVNSNKKFKSLFCWTTYLEQSKAIAAPNKCFKETFPCIKNGFRVGMKLEAIDPIHQSLFCIVTVAEIRGFRLRLHFDGYSDCYDFWVNADSTDIFKAGWCEKTGHQLQPPKGFLKDEFNWSSHLKSSKALAAPKNLFTNKTSNIVTPTGFRIGMKLEAVDKKTVFMDKRNSSTSLVCVATISDVMDNRILVHFDGWDTIYDYWSDSSSPFIHPVGWCQSSGHVLMPPNKCKDPEHFTWEAYLTKTKSQAAPSRAFKQRPVNGFKKSMKLEAVDPRNPSLIRVATVADIGSHQVKLHFDGWSDTYDFWVDYDSPDIHPVSWCEKTQHPLEPPPSKDYCVMVSGQGSGCPTPGCQGVGHIRGPKYTTHHSSFGCPYSHSNLSKDMGTPDRVKTSKDSKNDHKKLKCSSTVACDEETDQSFGKYMARNKSSNFPTESMSPQTVEDQIVGVCEVDDAIGDVVIQSEAESTSVKQIRGRRRKRKPESIQVSEEQCPPQTDIAFNSDVSSDGSNSTMMKCDSRSSSLNSMSLMSASSGPASIASELSSIVHRSIFMPGGNANGACIGADATSASFRRHAKLLPGLARLKGVDVGRWTVDQVTDFVRTLPGCQDVAKTFKDEQIDGEAFVLLNQADIVNLMNIKLGPALKIYNSIVMLHHMTAES